jgi:UDP-galactopyranose mutase
MPSKEERAEIAMAKEDYQKLRKQTRPDDITPELNLLGILADYEQYGEMEKVIREALKIQPNNEVLKELDEWVKAQKSKPVTKK